MAVLRLYVHMVLAALLVATTGAVELDADVEMGNGDDSDVGAELSVLAAEGHLNVSMLSVHDRRGESHWARFSGDDCVKQARADQSQCIPCKKNLTDGTQVDRFVGNCKRDATVLASQIFTPWHFCSADGGCPQGRLPEIQGTDLLGLQQRELHSLFWCCWGLHKRVVAEQAHSNCELCTRKHGAWLAKRR
mmetsp:Transcript_80826/g.237558  ORF Transcript_80826/g.237558 Transcript_80826/m.237558 type:complete len:191 (-) Transcript_80826:1297-1869(-)